MIYVDFPIFLFLTIHAVLLKVLSLGKGSSNSNLELAICILKKLPQMIQMEPLVLPSLYRSLSVNKQQEKAAAQGRAQIGLKQMVLQSKRYLQEKK